MFCSGTAHLESKDAVNGWVARQNTVVVITAYSCMISNALKHASFSSNFSGTQEESRRRFSAKIQRNEGESNCLSRFEKKPLAVKKQQEEDTSETSDGRASREKSQALFCRYKPCSAHTDEQAGEKLAVGIRARRCKFGAQKA